MPKNKPSEETLAQARRVIDALNERGAHKQAIRLKVTRPDAPLWIYGLIFVLYFLICYPLSLLSARLERKWES